MKTFILSLLLALPSCALLGEDPLDKVELQMSDVEKVESLAAIVTNSAKQAAGEDGVLRGSGEWFLFVTLVVQRVNAALSER